jgi:hypothetical protein
MSTEAAPAKREAIAPRMIGKTKPFVERPAA